MEPLQYTLSWTFLVLGSFFSLAGGIGLLRLPDFYTRIHAGGVTDTLGAGLILTGLMIHSGLNLSTAKLFLIFLFLLLTSATSSHALAKSALNHGLKPILSNENDHEHSKSQ